MYTKGKIISLGQARSLTTANFVCNRCNLSNSGALWPGMKPESGLIQTPSPSQHSVLTCTPGLTTSQSSPAHYSYPIQGKAQHGGLFFFKKNLHHSPCDLVQATWRGQHVCLGYEPAHVLCFCEAFFPSAWRLLAFWVVCLLVTNLSVCGWIYDVMLLTEPSESGRR